MRILITGAAGFLGSHLYNHHVAKGDDVLGLDNFSSSSPTSKHLAAMKAKGGTFKECDITADTFFEHSSEFIERHVLSGGTGHLDIIYNMACPASPPIYQKLPFQTLAACFEGTRNVLELANWTGARVVHASTSEVYGDPTVSPQRETYRGNVNSYGPRSCYDEGKRVAEALMYEYKNNANVDARIVRIFNTYGPNMDPNDGRVISNFICQAIRGEKLTVYGRGNQTRSVCYVDDLIDAIIKMGALDKNPETPINIGNPEEMTVNELAELVLSDFGVSMNVADKYIDRKPLPVDDPIRRCPDITLAREILGWEPRVSVRDGIKRTIEHFTRVLDQQTM